MPRINGEDRPLVQYEAGVEFGYTRPINPNEGHARNLADATRGLLETLLPRELGADYIDVEDEKVVSGGDRAVVHLSMTITTVYHEGDEEYVIDAIEKCIRQTAEKVEANDFWNVWVEKGILTPEERTTIKTPERLQEDTVLIPARAIRNSLKEHDSE